MLIELLTKKHPGMRLWLAQRISAVVMAFYVLIFIAVMAVMQPDSYETWLHLMSPWWWRAFTLIFFISLFIHAWLGVKNVFKDYIVNLKLRGLLQVVVDLLLITYLCLVFYILWDI